MATSLLLLTLTMLCSHYKLPPHLLKNEPSDRPLLLEDSPPPLLGDAVALAAAAAVFRLWLDWLRETDVEGGALSDWEGGLLLDGVC